MWVLAVVSAVGVLLSILKVLFGSYSLPYILQEYTTRKQIENTYAQMFRSRDAFLYHIGAERERGDMEGVKRLVKEMRALDEQIEDFEIKHYGRVAPKA